MAFEFDDEEDDDRDRDRRRAARRSRPDHSREQGSLVGDFLTFRSMVTPVIIQVVFWIGVLLCVAVGLRTIVSSTDGGGLGRKEFSPTMFAAGIAAILIGPVLVRVYCELLIIFFKIHDELKEANNRERRRG
jgi:hypothetical protein